VNVLVVEDDPSVCMVLELFLTNEGYQPSFVASGVKAYERFLQGTCPYCAATDSARKQRSQRGKRRTRGVGGGGRQRGALRHARCRRELESSAYGPRGKGIRVRTGPFFVFIDERGRRRGGPLLPLGCGRAK